VSRFFGGLQLAGRQVVVTYNASLAIFGAPIHMLRQQLLQLRFHSLVDQALCTRSQQLRERVVASLSTRQINHVTLAHSGAPPQVVCLSRSNKSTRYAAFFSNHQTPDLVTTQLFTLITEYCTSYFTQHTLSPIIITESISYISQSFAAYNPSLHQTARNSVF